MINISKKMVLCILIWILGSSLARPVMSGSLQSTPSRFGQGLSSTPSTRLPATPNSRIPPPSTAGVTSTPGSRLLAPSGLATPRRFLATPAGVGSSRSGVHLGLILKTFYKISPHYNATNQHLNTNYLRKSATKKYLIPKILLQIVSILVKNSSTTSILVRRICHKIYQKYFLNSKTKTKWSLVPATSLDEPLL